MGDTRAPTGAEGESPLTGQVRMRDDSSEASKEIFPAAKSISPKNDNVSEISAGVLDRQGEREPAQDEQTEIGSSSSTKPSLPSIMTAGPKRSLPLVRTGAAPP